LTKAPFYDQWTQIYRKIEMDNKELLQLENSKVYQEVLEANLNYAESFGEKSSLALPPSRQFAILTYMDARRAS